ncbi:pikachurin isoform X2 [Uranotaenia lowii]|uniref:pikachurin isoform X2 n=1 Tax=Uranotaenia lowii TaxID=190385 RepID=UPI00247A78C1|nr:pikachurin isoform X2 [Uranotaenia lowii]
MWLQGFLVAVLVCLVRCTEPDVSVEAAFQEINSTTTEESITKREEDVLYQRGASFSAKLDMSDLHISMKMYDEDDDGDGQNEGEMRPINLNALDGQLLPARKSNRNWKTISTATKGDSSQVPKSYADGHHHSNGPAPKSRKDVASSSSGSANFRPVPMESDDADSLRMQADEGENRSKIGRPDMMTSSSSNSHDEIKALALTALEDDEDDFLLLNGGRSTITATTMRTPQVSPEVTAGAAFQQTALTGTDPGTTLAPSSTREVERKPCSLDCGFEGVCSYGESGQAPRCICPFGKAGHKCEDDVRINTPRFNQHSWLAFPALRGAYKHVQLHIEFRPESFDGILLLTGERDDLTGDFMALLLHQGFVEFWFDCGSGTGRVRSEETIVLNQWNTITIYRHRWDAWLVLNQGNRVQGRSKGLFSRITFREPVFLGGFGNITGLDKKLPVSNGFTGCIRKFVANDHDYNFQQQQQSPSGPGGSSLVDVSQGFDIQECVTDRCSRFPCQHGGKCLPSDDGAICLCPLGFGGDLCEMRLDLQVPSFNGSSYLRYAPLGDTCIIWFELKIIIKPLLEDGLLLYSGHHEYGDYISLCLNMGYVEFTFDLGSGPATVRSEFPLTMGQWHTIKVSRTSRLAVLKIDQLPEVMTVSPNGFWHLSLPHSLYLGGVHNIHTLPMSLRDKGSFAGCVQKVDINDRTISIISEALGGSNVENCPHACVARPCGPLAKCVPVLDSYECQCHPQNRQCNQAEELPSDVIEQRQRLLKQHQVELQQEELLKEQLRRGELLEGEDDDDESGIEATTEVDGVTEKILTDVVASDDEYYYYYDEEEDEVGKDAVVGNEKIMSKAKGEKMQLDVSTQQPSGNDDDDDDDDDDYGRMASKDRKTLNENVKRPEYDDNDYDNDDDSGIDEDFDKDSWFKKGKTKAAKYIKPVKTTSIDKKRMSHKASDSDKKQHKDKIRKFYTANVDEDKNVGGEETDGFREEPENDSSSGSSNSNQNGNNKDYDRNGDRIPYRPDLLNRAKSGQWTTHQTRRGKGHEKHQPERDPDIDEILIEEMNRIMKNKNDFDGDYGGVGEQQQSDSDSLWSLDEEEARHQGAPLGGDTQNQPLDPIRVEDNDDGVDDEDNDDDDDDNDDDVARKDSTHSTSDVDGMQHNPRRDKNPNSSSDPLKLTTHNTAQESSKPLVTGSQQQQRFKQSKLNQNHGDGIPLPLKPLKYQKNKYPRRYQGACFTGTESFFHYSDAETMRRVISYEIDLNLRFKTHSTSGLILWTGRHSALEGDDFLSLGIENGYLHLRYNLGSGEINIKYNATKVSDGLWHRVRALRNSQDGTLKVDGGKSITRRSPGKLRQLNTDTGLYVGGLPAASFYTRQRYTSGIVGCISELILAGELRLNFDSTILGTAHNVEPGAP